MTEITKTDAKWQISGDLLLDDIEGLLAQHVVMAGPQSLEVDMSGVTDVDSITISLLFEWLRQAKGQKRELVYTNLPANLTSLASLYGVLDLIPQAADQAVPH
ncbi:MAG: STAS domain-containing protein [Nitrosomonadales bacterium]|nr:STAS domain-containing protein [Nitrosomonadales bacterium]